MSDDDGVIRARAGSGLDLAHRMDRMEQKHEDLAKEVASLSSVVARVEQNQAHSTELAKLRFDALDAGLKSLGGQLTDFTKYVGGLIDGSVQTNATRQGQELVADYQKWRAEVDEFRDQQTIRNTAQDARQAGVFSTLGATRAFVLMLVAILSPIIAFIISNK